MANIEYWLNYDDVGRPREPGKYFSPSYKFSVEISEEAYAAWSESGFTSPLPIYSVKSEMNPQDPPQYIADIPEVVYPEGMVSSLSF
jgi:hypothetical protein